MQLNSITSNNVGVLQKQQGIQQLTNAVNSNNIDQAKQIFQIMFSNTPAVKLPSSALYALNQALQSGNIQNAQAALVMLQSQRFQQEQQEQQKTTPAVLPNVGKLINVVA